MPKKAAPKSDVPDVTPNRATVAVSPEYAQAKRRVMMYKVFFAHAIVFVSVNALLMLIDIATGGGLWFHWALFGWGIGLAAHAGVVWGAPHLQAWEERMIAREMQRRTQ